MAVLRIAFFLGAVASSATANSLKCAAADPSWTFDGEVTLGAGQTAQVKCVEDGVPNIDTITCPESFDGEVQKVIGEEISCQSIDRALQAQATETNTSTGTTTGTTTDTTTVTTTVTTTHTTTHTTTMTTTYYNETNDTMSNETEDNMTTTPVGDDGRVVAGASTASALMALFSSVALTLL